MVRTALTAALIAGLCAVPARADPVADFYKGAVVSMVVSTSAGGGYDTLARAIARHIGKHASGAKSTPAFFARLLNATLHTRMKIIPGFPGQNDAFLAMERGELDGYPSVFYSALSSTRPSWLPDKKAKAIVQYGPEKLTELADVPFAPDLVTDPADKQLLQLAFTPLALGRPLLLPPNAPADRVAALRKALMETFADPNFLADAKKTGLQVNSPRNGDELVRVIERAYHAPPQIIARLRELNKP